MTFGEHLYKLRTNKNVSQEQLAEILDVSRQSISKWENNKGYPELSRFIVLSDYFEISLDYLIKGIENKESSKVKYASKGILVGLNSFASNLSKRQAKFLSIFITLVSALIIINCVYALGYAIGKAIFHLGF